MMGSEILRLLELIGATSKRTEKEALLAAHKEDETLKWVLHQAYNPYITFGIKPARPPLSRHMPAGVIAQDLIVPDIFNWVKNSLNSLATRQSTGNAAQALVNSLFDRLNNESADLIWRIITKDLKAGFTENTINKVIPGHVPTFDVMLAKPFEEKRVKVWPQRISYVAEPKLDGVRVLALVDLTTDESGVRIVSREGRPFPAMDHLREPIAKMVRHIWESERLGGSTSVLEYFGGDAPRLVLDGEMTSGIFNKSVGDVRRKSVKATDATYTLFDILPYDAFMARKCATPYSARRVLMRYFANFAELFNAPIAQVEKRLIASLDQLMEYYNEVRAAGGEGLIFKPLDHKYEFKRSFSWLKLKNEATEDLVVIGAFEGEPNTKYAGQLGGLIVDRNGVQVRIGGGLSDEQRREFWAAYLEDTSDEAIGGMLLGRVIEVEYQEVTPDGSLRHPRFVRFRDDKASVSAAA